MRQKMKKNVPNCCLTLIKYLNLHLSTLKELKNAKKVKWDRPTDQPTNRQTDIKRKILLAHGCASAIVWEIEIGGVPENSPLGGK